MNNLTGLHVQEWAQFSQHQFFWNMYEDLVVEEVGDP